MPLRWNPENKTNEIWISVNMTSFIGFYYFPIEIANKIRREKKNLIIRGLTRYIFFISSHWANSFFSLCYHQMLFSNIYWQKVVDRTAKQWAQTINFEWLSALCLLFSFICQYTILQMFLIVENFINSRIECGMDTRFYRNTHDGTFRAYDN